MILHSSNVSITDGGARVIRGLVEIERRLGV
jgi:hypothetical protein